MRRRNAARAGLAVVVATVVLCFATAPAVAVPKSWPTRTKRSTLGDTAKSTREALRSLLRNPVTKPLTKVVLGVRRGFKRLGNKSTRSAVKEAHDGFVVERALGAESGNPLLDKFSVNATGVHLELSWKEVIKGEITADFLNQNFDKIDPFKLKRVYWMLYSVYQDQSVPQDVQRVAHDAAGVVFRVLRQHGWET